MLCHRCQVDFDESHLYSYDYPVICEEGREIRTAMVCCDCLPILMEDNDKLYSHNNRLMDLMEFETLSPAALAEANGISDEVYPLIPERVPSTVPASLEAWCKEPESETSTLRGGKLLIRDPFKSSIKLSVQVDDLFCNLEPQNLTGSFIRTEEED